MSLEKEVDQMINDVMKREGWSRPEALRTLRSKFKSEERYQQAAYVNRLLKQEEQNSNNDYNNSDGSFQEDN